MCVSNLKFEKLKRYARTLKRTFQRTLSQLREASKATRTLKRTIKIRTFLIKDGPQYIQKSDFRIRDA